MTDSPHTYAASTADQSRQPRPLTATGVLATLVLVLVVPAAAWAAHNPGMALATLAGATGATVPHRIVRRFDDAPRRPVRIVLDAAASASPGE